LCLFPFVFGFRLHFGGKFAVAFLADDFGMDAVLL
jgi:hypothetical protein